MLMTHPRVICVGEILYDNLADDLGRSLADVTAWTPFPGGAPANVACALARLGIASAWVGCVGTDETGTALLNVLKTRGVNNEGAQRHPTAPTRQVFVTRSLAGEREFAGFGDRLTSEYADAFLQAEHLPEGLFAGADILVSGTSGLAFSETKQALERSLGLAERHAMNVAIDINWRPMFWPNPDAAPDVVLSALQRADYLKCSDDEAQWLFQTERPEDIASRLPRARGIAVTAGDRGCTYLLDGQSGRVPAYAVRTIDTTGAGDSFLAGWLYAMTEFGLDISKATPELAERIFRFASAAGALTTTRAGAIAAQPTVKEIHALLARDRE